MHHTPNYILLHCIRMEAAISKTDMSKAKLTNKINNLNQTKYAIQIEVKLIVLNLLHSITWSIVFCTNCKPFVCL